MEIWKDIKDYEGMYQVSNLGNVRSLDYFVNSWRGPRLKKGKMMNPTDNGNGYKIVSLSKENLRKNHYLHRLVAEAFLEKPNGCDVINHKDYNRSNNNAENLEWTTQLENIRYSQPNRRYLPTKEGKYGKYIRFDKRYGSFTVAIYDKKTKKKTYLGTYKTHEEAITARNNYMWETVKT